MRSQDVATWVMVALQTLFIVGAVIVYLTTLPSRGYIDARIKPLEADIKELRNDIQQLQKDYKDHLAYHIDNPK